MAGKQITIEDLYELMKSVAAQNEVMKQDISKIDTNIKNLSEKIEYLNNKTEKLVEENKSLKNRIEVLERQSKKYNIIVYGLQESTNYLQQVKSLIENLEIQISPFEIRDCHPIGKTREGYNRPVIVELLTYQLKTDIIKRARGNEYSNKKGIYISNDYSKEVYQQRKFLLSQVKTAREKGIPALLKNNNSILMQGKLYSYEDLKQKELTNEENQEVEIEQQTIDIPGDKKRKEREESPVSTYKNKTIRSSSRNNKK